MSIEIIHRNGDRRTVAHVDTRDGNIYVAWRLVGAYIPFDESTGYGVDKDMRDWRIATYPELPPPVQLNRARRGCRK